ncbi:chromatin-remodeling ATPase INO80-like isoform X1 [Aristolochia californica]|uniref:chromatin-remodeling ATPase INO80-like isoform X1 n=1 Tax=Aristolochia californica TaxID=171875 RepID=UPI0035DEAF64
MEQKRHSNNGFSYSNIFNLEPLMNFQLPQRDDDFGNYGNSSQDESRGTQDQDKMAGNGFVVPSELGVRKRKRTLIEAEAGSNSSAWRDPDSNDEDEEDYGAYISEERYRSMLGEHLQKYRRVRFKESSSLGLTSSRGGMPIPKRSNHSSRSRKLSNEERGLHAVEPASDFLADMSIKQAAYYEPDFTSEYAGVDSFSSPSFDSFYLDIGEGVTYRIPPSYDKLVTSLTLPSFSDVRVKEYFLKGTLDLGSLAAMMASDRRLESRNRSGMGDPQPQYYSLQARLKALSASNSVQKFSLQVCDNGLDSSIPEGAAGGIQRSIMSEGGTLQVYYVKVLEKGDTYEIIERRLPMKQELEKDPSVIEKEEIEKFSKVWVNMIRKDIPKHHKAFVNLHRKQISDAKRSAETCQREVKLKVSRSLKLMRGAAIRTRKLARDMLVFWKRVDKEQAEIRKREEKEAAEALKREEELREAKRQQQRLNFLLSQTELYSHFMQNKSTSENLALADGEGNEEALSEITPGEEDDPEDAELKREALRAAQQAFSQQKKITSAFDSECQKLRQAIDSEAEANDNSIAGSSDIDLLHPSTMPTKSSVQTPESFNGSLKEYQLKGLQWLVNCYEQGLNGILADEMGLGKTIQAMAFLAHLAEEKNIWGPFLVVAPTSVLNNWADEFNRFCPDLKTLPYWGGLRERMILRKNINPKRLYRRDSGFHILITSYQLLVSDEKYFQRVKWQYMVLDEAQAIKSSASIRWKTLLSFNCRNRLLLTGTPIQNNMAELWALLHFIMPTLFDSHEQFNEWFSKGIENHAEHGGTLNEHQLNRLHAVLKPFMLRRVKKDVILEMTGKTEVTVHCKLSSRQQAFYQAIKNKISLTELFDGRRGHLNEKKLLNLMNIVIQLRKVCNHPELFERNEGTTYLYFGDIPNSLLPPPFGELEDIHYSGGQNPIAYEVPKLVYREIMRHPEIPCSPFGHSIGRESFEKHFNMFSLENVYQSIFPQNTCMNDSTLMSGTFGFTRLADLSPVEVSFLASGSILERLLFSVSRWEQQLLGDVLDMFMTTEGDDSVNDHMDKEKVRCVARMLLLPTKSESMLLRRKLATGLSEALVTSHQDRFISNTRLLHSAYAFIPPARAPPISAHCSDRNFAYKMTEELHHPWVKRLFLGFARTSESNGPRVPSKPYHLIQEVDSELPVAQPLLQLTYKIFGSSPPVRNFDPAKLLTDSGKLQTLDILLKRLRAENHRVLLFAQMTKMLNILEDYMNYRKYRYLRLDGSSTIMDRHDMVREFQCRSDIFVFLLSTRAGGLGINLTAADTVIFYESDWNPTLDLQAMDRAHRLGQTKEVTVYRLICKETVEEKILQRASQKNTVQQLVMTGGHVQGEYMPAEDVVSLLLDDTQLEQKLREAPLHQAKYRQKKKRVTKGIRIDAEGDATLEDISALESQPAGNELSNELENVKSSNKKIKANPDTHMLPKPQKASKGSKNVVAFSATKDLNLLDYEGNEDPQQKSKRPKRMKKNMKENLDTAFDATLVVAPGPAAEYPHQNSNFSALETPSGSLSPASQ